MWNSVTPAFATLEMVFGIVFVIEVSVRLFAEGLGFWKEAWNWLDFVVTAVQPGCSINSLFSYGMDPYMVVRVLPLPPSWEQ